MRANKKQKLKPLQTELLSYIIKEDGMEVLKIIKAL
jgi:hypothetical protein